MIKHCVKKHLTMLKIQNMMDIKGVLFQWFIIFFDKKTSGGAVKNVSNQDLAEEFTNQLLENLKNEKYTHLL